MPTQSQLLRFNLKSLLMAIGIVAILLGYSQWRRQSILREYATLRSDGVHFDLPDAWNDKFWQRHPSEVVLLIEMTPTNESSARFVRNRDRLERMGVKYLIRGWPPMMVR